MAVKLNENQIKAVKHKKGPMMVLAGPGSGKTMVITHRVKSLINKHHISPENILVITFTKASANEMKNRFINLMQGKPQVGKVTFGTFHSIYFRIVRAYYGYNVQDILKEEKKIELFRKIIRSLNIEVDDENEFTNEVMGEISLMRGELIELRYYHPYSCSKEDYGRIIQAYEDYKQLKHYIDFDDMLTLCWKLLVNNAKVQSNWQKRFEYILIDEFQDINRVQYEIIKLLAEPQNNLFIVGDDDQSIYQFRGARPEFLLNFTKEYLEAKTVVLNQNYRSTSQIVNHSNQLIKNNTNRHIKEMKTVNSKGAAPTILELSDSEDEALKIGEELLKIKRDKHLSFSEMAIIYRTNIQARALIDVLSDMNIPFVIRDKMGSIYDHWITRDILAYIQLARTIKDVSSISRIINKPNRYISRNKLEQCKNAPDFWNALYKQYEEQEWMINRLEELRYHCQVLRTLSPRALIKYIRTEIGYNQYIENYASFKKISQKGLTEILNELQESTKGKQSIDEWLEHIEEVKELIKENQHKNKGKACVTLTTMHSAKGLEYTLVWIIGANEGIIPHQKSNREKEIEEERRLFYVGITRAKELLYISYLKVRYDELAEPSRFIDEIDINYPIEQLKDGSKIYHKKFGEGIIQSKKGKSSEVIFKNSKKKMKINLKYCYDQELITIISI